MRPAVLAGASRVRAQMRLRRAAVLALMATPVVIPACRSNDDLITVTEPFTLGVGRVHLAISGDGSTLSFLRDTTTLLSFDRSAFQIGVTSTPQEDQSYDPWEIEQRGAASSGIELRAPIRSEATLIAEGAEARVNLDFGDGLRAKVAIALVGETRFTLNLIPEESPPGAPTIVVARVRARTSGDPTEGFYGLGEHLDSVDNRGKLRAMQLETEPEVESSSNEAHVPVPFVLGTRGWGLFATTYRTGVFDVARKDPSVIEATFAVASLSPGTARAESLRVDVFAADSPLDLYREYFAASGEPRPPPPWAFGPWLWRDEAKDQTEIESDIRTIRELDLPTSGVWLDQPFASAVSSFDFQATRFPDPKRMIDKAHAAGLKLAVWSAPYLEDRAEPMASEAKAQGFFPTKAGALSNPWGPPFDFVGPAASGYWRGLVRRYITLGVDGFTLDYGEDVVPSRDGMRNAWTFSDGSDERTMHHRYSALYHRAYIDAAIGREPAAPPPRPNVSLPFVLVRAAHWGEQSLALIVRAGDMDATFTAHKERFTSRDGSEVLGVGGLPATVTMNLSLASSGFSFFASDTGGYRHSPPDKELFLRWAEQSALSTVMEVGDASSQPPWINTPDNGRDAEALDVYRTYARLHTRLFPYVWTYAVRMIANGYPITRPLGLAYPELGVHPSDQYLFGDDLLVAPVLTRGQTRRRLILPRGTWIDFWDATPYTPNLHREGSEAVDEVEVDAPLGKLPLLIREGAILPMLRPTIDSLAPATDDTTESFARDPGLLWAMIAPGPPRQFELWDGSRIARITGDSFEVESGAVFDRGFVLELMSAAEPVQISRDEGLVPKMPTRAAFDAAAVGWTWGPERRGTLLIKLPAGAAKIVVR